MSDRGTGRTTKQMLDAPRGAFFVCPTTAAREYTRHLAHHLGRLDLNPIVPEELEYRIRGTGRAVIVDHACRLTERQHEMIRAHRVWEIGE
jgi:hypothetical protein